MEARHWEELSVRGVPGHGLFNFSPSGSVRWPSTPRCGFFKFCNVRYVFFFSREVGFWCRCPPQVGDLRYPSNIHQTPSHLTFKVSNVVPLPCRGRAAVNGPGICYGKKPVVLRGLDASKAPQGPPIQVAPALGSLRNWQTKLTKTRCWSFNLASKFLTNGFFRESWQISILIWWLLELNMMWILTLVLF